MVNFLKFFHIFGVSLEGLYPLTYIQISIVHGYMYKNEVSKQHRKQQKLQHQKTSRAELCHAVNVGVS